MTERVSRPFAVHVAELPEEKERWCCPGALRYVWQEPTVVRDAVGLPRCGVCGAAVVIRFDLVGLHGRAAS